VDRCRRRGMCQIADGRDRVAANADICAKARASGAVDHVTVDDADVELRLLRRSLGRARECEKKGEERAHFFANSLAPREWGEGGAKRRVRGPSSALRAPSPRLR